MTTKGLSAVALSFGLALPALFAAAQIAPSADPGAAQRYFTDVVLTDQDGRPMRLYSDLLAGKVVVINALFTECTGSCPVMGRKFQALQEHLGDRLGADVHLISITVDPATDTPERLKEFGRRFGARPGWYLLTGPRENVEFALRKLGQYAEVREAHQTVFLVGNTRTGLWKKAFGLAKTEDVVAIVDSVLHDRGEG